MAAWPTAERPPGSAGTVAGWCDVRLTGRSGPVRDRDVPILAIAAVCIAVVAVLVAVWQRGGLVATSATRHVVTYRTDGTAATTTVVFRSPTGTKRETGVVIPLTTLSDGSMGRHFTMYAPTPVALSVTNETATGSVTCIIEIDGVETSRKTSNEPFGTSSCQGTLP